MSTLNFQIPPPIIGPVIGGKNKTVSHQAICGEGIAFQLVRRENTRGESPTTPTFVLRGASRLMILDLEADPRLLPELFAHQAGLFRHSVLAVVHIVVLQEAECVWPLCSITVTLAI
jgi:hypothetical protein